MTQPTWQYRLTPEALIEEIAGRTRFYGRWDWCFGCWEGDAAGPWRDLVPDWRMLDARGVWLPPAAIRGPAGYPADPAWTFEARAAYAAYFSLIPVRVRLRAAQHGPGQWRELLVMAHRGSRPY
ncbi:MAG: hypothetical protein RBS99_18830 [Rhodospirillales bacterium]|jgi:hypothetical protein|nr:hypothetical protein [Rhodospirillales bacterium]